MISGQTVHRATPGRATGYQMTYDIPNIKYVIPTEGAIRGSDTMVVLSGAPHPIAANLWINFNLDAQVSAANTNYIGYMGPNAAAMQFIEHGDPRGPDRQPAIAASSTSSSSSWTSGRRPRQVHDSAGTRCKA